MSLVRKKCDKDRIEALALEGVELCKRLLEIYEELETMPRTMRRDVAGLNGRDPVELAATLIKRPFGYPPPRAAAFALPKMGWDTGTG